MKPKARHLCLAALYILAVPILAAAGTASAANTLLFKPLSGKFPYHLVGLLPSGKTATLETTGGAKIQGNGGVHVLVLVLDPTLAHIDVLILNTFADGSESNSCGLNKASEKRILIELLGHLGLAHPGDVPAVLGLVPTGFEFKCEILKIEAGVKALGSIIAKIIKPAILTESSEQELEFKQTKGIQEFNEFLLPGGVLMAKETLTVHLLGKTEQAGIQAPAFPLKPLEGEGNFALVDE